MAVLLESANSEYLSADAVPYSQLGANGLTFAGWFRLVSDNITGAIMALSDPALSSDKAQFLQAQSVSSPNIKRGIAGTRDADDPDVEAISIVGNSAFTLNTWHPVAGVWNGPASRTVYVDGVAGTESTVDLDPDNLDTLNIGRIAGLGNHFDGYLAHIGIWKRALTADEVDALAKGLSPRRLPVDLWAYLPLLYDARDEVGNATWTENGTVTYDQTIHPELHFTRLGLYGGPRPIYGLFGPKAAQIVARDASDLTRLGLYGGPRGPYGTFGPKEAGAPVVVEARKRFRGLMVNPSRMISRL